MTALPKIGCYPFLLPIPASWQFHHPRAVTIDALIQADIQVLSTSTESNWDVVLTIDQDSTMAWDIPDEPIFYWGQDGSSWNGYLLD